MHKITISLLLMCLASCSSQAWYQGTQSAHEAYCLKQPVSEYQDCMQSGSENYLDYEKKRKNLIK